MHPQLDAAQSMCHYGVWVESETVAQNTAMQFLSLLLPIVLATALPGLGVLIREWREERDRTHRLAEVLEHANKEVTFLRNWMKTTFPLLNVSEQEQSQQKLREALIRIRCDVEEVTQAPSLRQTRRSRRWWRELFLVGYAQTWWLKVLRISYLVILGISFLFIVIGVIAGNSSGNFAKDVLLNTLVSIFVLIPTIALWLITRGSSRTLRRRSQT